MGFVTFTTPDAPHVINAYSYSDFCSSELGGEFCYREFCYREFCYRGFCYHEAFGAPKRVFPRLADNTQSQDKY